MLSRQGTYRSLRVLRLHFRPCSRSLVVEELAVFGPVPDYLVALDGYILATQRIDRTILLLDLVACWISYPSLALERSCTLSHGINVCTLIPANHPRT